MSDKIIEMVDVSKWFDDFQVLKNINLEVLLKQKIVVCGPSGSGKSTLIRCINRLEEHQKGKIVVDGIELSESTKNIEKIRAEVGMVFQQFNLFPHLSIVDNCTLAPIWVKKMPKKHAEEFALKELEKVKILDQAKKFPGQLSGGQQQRVAVARAIVLEPKALLFDEPLSNLDAKLRRQVREDIRELQQELDVTTIYVTHDQEEALAISDKVIVMNNAVIAQEGRPKDLYNNPKTTFVANFIGDANIIKARIETRNENNYDINFGGIQMKISSNIDLKDSVSIALRPETIEIIKEK